MAIDLSKSNTQWPLSLKLRRGLWTYLLAPLVCWLPKACSPLRVAALRLMGARIGLHCLILPGVRVLMPWNLHLEDYVALGEGANLYNFALISIGGRTVISQRSYLCTGTHDYTHPHMPLTWEPITIGSECWVAAEAFVAPGVSIGNGAVVGARSVVTKDMPEWMVCAGNPCRPIKARLIQSL